MSNIVQNTVNKGKGQKRVAVIGAGPAGLVTTRSLQAKGLKVTTFERGTSVGGTWTWGAEHGRDFLYRNLHINTSKRLTAFRDHPFGSDVQPIPDHEDMSRYMKSYAEAFDLMPHIRLNTEVTKVSPIAGTSCWTVTTKDGETEEFDAVVVCSGPFNRPSHVTSFETFGGVYTHSAEYREPAPYAGKSVCIVGAGNSAVDIASDICTAAKDVVLIARSPVAIVPHTFFGANTNDISRTLQARWVPSGLRRRLLKLMSRMVHGDLTKLGFRPLTHRVHATISSTIVQDILFRRVNVKNGIEAIDGTTIRFADGTSGTFDALIAATGFVTEFPFLPDGLSRPESNRLDLYNRIVPPGFPGLFFVGMINIDTPVNFACERQARWVAAMLAQDGVLPPEREMRAAILERSAWIARHYGPSQRHALQEESKLYYRDLDLSLKQALSRASTDKARSTSQSNVTGQKNVLSEERG